MTEIFLERKKNGQIQELICNMWLILCYTVQLVIPNVCIKFQNPKSSSFREIFDRKKVNKHTHTHTHKHINRKGKNYIPPIYFVCRGYNQAVQLQKNARGLKFWIEKVDGFYYLCSQNKGADQLRSYPEADLRLCFCICKMLVFL